MVAGLLAERSGYKKTMLGALIMVIGAIFLLFFAQNIGMLMAGDPLRCFVGRISDLDDHLGC